MLKHRTINRQSPWLFKKADKMAANGIHRARKKGLPHDSRKTLRDECLRQMVQTRGRCPYLYKRYQINNGVGGGDFSPTLDKKVPSKGYVVGNIEVISSRANRIKSDADSLEVRAVAEAMELRGL